MRKAYKVIILVLSLVTLSSINVMASVNKESILSFTTNGQKDDSSERGVKPDDGDNRGYITTLPSYNGITSGVFPRGGTFYARIRSESEPDLVFTNLFTFYQNESQNQTYYANRLRFGQYHLVRGETDGIIYPYPSGYVYQCIRWCP